MTEFERDPSKILNQRLQTVELSLRQQGVLGEIAGTATNGEVVLEAAEAGNVLLPPKQAGEDSKPRYELIANASDAVKLATMERAEEVLGLATQLGMRFETSLPETELARIKPEQAIWVVEGGANRTSVVRRQLALEAMATLYSNDELTGQTIYQFGSDRAIPREKNDKPNPEYSVAQEIGGEFLPDTDNLTEFKLNLASALQAGYNLVQDASKDFESVDEVLVLAKADQPKLVLVRPQKQSGGLDDGFSAVREIVGDVTERQFVVATNGQYRPKDELQARKWATTENQSMLPAVALGDEAGYQVEHNGSTIKTADRQPTAYVNEIVILHRLSQ